jgi:hypothetical protein
VTRISTGINDPGNVLPDGATDPHLQLIQNPDVAHPGSGTFVVDQGGFPLGGCWYKDDNISKWIAPYADASTVSPEGRSFSETTFNLSGFDPATARITGTWSTDNEGMGILLNGIPTGFNTPGESYRSPSPFGIEGGFLREKNELDGCDRRMMWHSVAWKADLTECEWIPPENHGVP